MDFNVTPVTPTKARKRVVQKDKWKSNVAKTLRYSSKGMPEYPTCGHKTKSLKCATLRMKDLQIFHKCFYNTKSKISQDSFILKHISTTNCKRSRPSNNSRKPKETTVKCFIRSQTNEMVPVCKNSFMKILGITKHRISYVSEEFRKTGVSPKEKRGGDRKSNKMRPKRMAVEQFLNKLKCVESHYCRSASSARRYLPSNLNITKLFKMYDGQASAGDRVKSWLFRDVFNKRYNLGFGSPRTDTCSTCSQFHEKIKQESDSLVKANLMALKRVHKLKAKAFYALLREKRDDLMTFSFDCQKNQVLPKVPDQSAYYSRQLYVYNLTIVKGSSKTPLTSDNVFCFTWTEDEYKKGSNEVASAVYNVLLSSVYEPTIETVRLVADGCSGQNKNSSVIAMCHRWLRTAPMHIKYLEIVFPVVGHSFLPSDRVFGNIEKDIKKIEVIASPEEYRKIFSEHGKVINIGAGECDILDWKEQAALNLKVTSSWHFKIKACKRFFLSRNNSGRVLIKGDMSYRSSLGDYKSILKGNRSVLQINPSVIEKGVLVKPAKLHDVNKLLAAHFGPQWRDRDDLFYFKRNIPETIAPGDDIDEEIDGLQEGCEIQEEQTDDLMV